MFKKKLGKITFGAWGYNPEIDGSDEQNELCVGTFDKGKSEFSVVLYASAKDKSIHIDTKKLAEIGYSLITE